MEMNGSCWQYLVRGVKAVPRAARLGRVQHAHLPAAGLEQRRAPVVMVRQHLQEVLRSLLQPVVDTQRVSGAQLQVQLQDDGLGVLGVQRPRAPQLRRSAPVGSKEIRGSKGAVEVAQAPAAGGVGAAQLVGAVGTVAGAVAAQGGRQAAGGLGLGARQGAQGAKAGTGLGGRGGASAFVRAVAALVLAVALPGARKTLAVPTQEFVRLTAALTQVTCREGTSTGSMYSHCLRFGLLLSILSV